MPSNNITIIDFETLYGHFGFKLNILFSSLHCIQNGSIIHRCYFILRNRAPPNAMTSSTRERRRYLPHRWTPFPIGICGIRSDMGLLVVLRWGGITVTGINT